MGLLPPLGSNRVVAIAREVTERPVKTESLNKIQSLITPKCPDFN